MVKVIKRLPSRYRAVICVICGTLFLTNHSQGKYCSQECRIEGQRKSSREYGERNRQKRRKYYKKYYNNNKEKITERISKYKQSSAGKKAQRISDIRQRQKNPKRYKAHQEVLKAIRKGILTKQQCEFCGSTENIEAHHEDYDKSLEVIWLCKKCHRKLHLNKSKEVNNESSD
jgi:hypothetical protein